MESLPIIVLGAGGHAKVVIDTMHQLNMNILGLTVRNAVLTGTMVLGEKILGTDAVVPDYGVDKIRLANAVGSVSSPGTRLELFERFMDQGYDFVSLVHPRATLCSSVTIGRGSQFFAGSVVQSGTHIGNNVIVNANATIDHDCHIGSHVHIASGAILCGAVTVGRSAYIGAGAIVKEGLSIGVNAIIAPGSVVLSDVPPNTRVSGHPAKRA
jgi:sugar O-acyltransferase (sialic acid O-acetyltransferase NeuD family)